MSQVNAPALYKSISVVEYVVVSRTTVYVSRVSDILDFSVVDCSLVNWVNESIVVLINDTETVFVVVIPLTVD